MDNEKNRDGGKAFEIIRGIIILILILTIMRIVGISVDVRKISIEQSNKNVNMRINIGRIEKRIVGLEEQIEELKEIIENQENEEN